jgi:hypothetical protein
VVLYSSDFSNCTNFCLLWNPIIRLYRSCDTTNQRVQFDIEPCGKHLATGGQVCVSCFHSFYFFFRAIKPLKHDFCVLVGRHGPCLWPSRWPVGDRLPSSCWYMFVNISTCINPLWYSLCDLYLLDLRYCQRFILSSIPSACYNIVWAQKVWHGRWSRRGIKLVRCV